MTEGSARRAPCRVPNARNNSYEYESQHPADVVYRSRTPFTRSTNSRSHRTRRRFPKNNFSRIPYRRSTMRLYQKPLGDRSGRNGLGGVGRVRIGRRTHVSDIAQAGW